MLRMVHPCMLSQVSMMSTGTFCVYPLLRLTSMLKVYLITRLITRKGNLSKANLRANVVILMTHKGSPCKAILRASKGRHMVRKDSIIALPINLCSLRRGTNRDQSMVLGGKSSLLNLCKCSIMLFLMLHISQDHPMALLQVKPVTSNHLALFLH